MNAMRSLVLAGVIGSGCVVSHPAPAEEAVTMPAVQKRIVVSVSAPARVQAASSTVLSAPTAGIVAGVRVLPGEAVSAGQAIAQLGGPTVAAERARLASDLKSAQIRASAAEEAAAIEQRKFAQQLSTRDALIRAHAERDTAREQLVAAQAALRSYAGMATIAAPGRGVVTAVNVADGQYVSAGQALLTMAPTRALHVVADFYGGDAAAVSAGMQGRFLAEGADAPVDVVVLRTSWNVAAPGQLEVWFNAAAGHVLSAGEVGTISLTVSGDKRLAIPSSALVLDAGQWWVLVCDKGGSSRRQVVPGLADGGWTAIMQGLSPGERVVTQDAYLLFHEDFATRYQQTD